MNYEVSFGSIKAQPRTPPAPGQKFRLALFGDFSGRANAGKLETGAALASRKPIPVDVDNLETVMQRMGVKLALDLAGDGNAVDIAIGEIDDFHPDQLAENVELFESLMTLRKNLSSRAGFDRAAKEVLSWSGELPIPPPPRRPRGAAIATDKKLSDFARLTGRKAASEEADQSVDDLLRRIVGPLVQPARDARQEQLVARVDLALTDAMRRVLHHPDFQAAEATWRGVDFLVRRIETGARMQIVLYDVSAEELAADLAATDQLDRTGLYGMLAEQPLLDANQGPLSAVIGLYGFELSPPHADLLGRIAQIAGNAGAPFIAGIGPDGFRIPEHEQPPLIRDAWSALRGLKASAYLGLATPRFLLRMPYGKKSDPIDAFAFEEFSRETGLSGMLWGHPALIPALLLGLSWAQQGAKIKLGAIMGVGDIPYYVYTDPEGDQIALPCTERLYTERQAVQVSTYGVMPLISLRGRPEVRLGSFNAVGGAALAGFWAPADVSGPPAPRAVAAPPPAAEAPPEPAAEAPEPAAAGDADLDALLGSLQAAPAPAAAAPPEPAADDLDALLASLSAEPEPPAAGATDPDLDALLASLQ
jgi:type VI secretion system protein ImpC